MLEEMGTKVSIATVKLVLYRHNLKGCSARKKPLLQNRHKTARLRFATAHGDIDHTFGEMSSDLMKQKLYGCIEATSQDISQEVKAWVQMGLPNGQ